MSDTTVDTVGSGPLTSVTHDGFTVVANSESEKDMQENFDSEPKPLDGDDEDLEREKEKADKKRKKEAASELGKAGGKASAEARAAKAEKEPEPEKEPEKPKDKPEPDEAEPEKEPGNPRHDAKARIQQLAREKNEERAARRELEARLETLEAERAKPKVDLIPPTEEKRPRPDQFGTYEEYVEAAAEYKAEQKLHQVMEAAERKRAADSHANGIVQRIETFKERLADEPDLVSRVDERLLNLQPTFTLPPGTQPGPLNVIADEIISSEVTAKLMLHLTEHPEEMSRLAKLPNAREIARAVARLEDKLTAPPASPPTSRPVFEEVSRAAPPVRPVSTSAAAYDDDLDDDAPLDRHISVMNTREAKLRRVR